MINKVKFFSHNKEGVAAVEFALIAPIMITLFFGAVELSDGLLANRKVTSVASSVADLVSQDTQIDDAGMADIFKAAQAIIVPYNFTDLSVRVSSINIDFDGTTQVGWSDGYNTSSYSPGTNFALPTGIGQPGGSVIVTEVSYNFESILGHIIVGTLTFEDKFFARPRRVLRVSRIT